MYNNQEYMVISPSSSVNDPYNDNTGYYDNNHEKVSLELGQVFNNDSLTTNDAQWLNQVIDLQELLGDIAPSVVSDDYLSPISPLQQDLTQQLSPISVQDVDDCFLSTADNRWSKDAFNSSPDFNYESSSPSSHDSSPTLSPYMSPLTASVYNNVECYPFTLPNSPLENKETTCSGSNYMENGSLSPAFSTHSISTETITNNESILPDISDNVDFDFDIDFNNTHTVSLNTHLQLQSQVNVKNESSAGPIRNKKSKSNKIYGEPSNKINSEFKSEEKKIRKKQQNKDAAIRYRRKKKAESEVLSEELFIVETKHYELNETVEQLEKQVAYLRDLMSEVKKAKTQQI